MTDTLTDIRKIIDVPLSFPESIYSGQRTYTSLFLVPAFLLDVNVAVHKYLVNCYIDDFQLNHNYKRPMFLLLEVDSVSSLYFKEVDKDLKNNKNFVYDYIVGCHGNNLLLMYVFECPDEYREDYDKFLEGKYSKFSEKYKSHFSKVYETDNGEIIESPLYGTIYKTLFHKKKVEKLLWNPGEGKLDPSQEYFGIPEKAIEIFRYEKQK